MNEESKRPITRKSLTALGKFMRFLVENAYSFTVAVMGLVHATLAVIFLIADVIELVQFNIVSVIIYVFCFILCRSGHILPVYASIILEVTIYSVVSTYYVGLRCGTYCFLFSIIPIIIYFGSSLFKGSQRLGVAIMLILNFLMFAVLYVSFFEAAPVYNVPRGIMLILVILSALAMVLSTMFYNAMYIFSSENQVNILEKKNRQLSAVAHEDALTSILNRRGFLPLVRDLMEEPGNHFIIAFCDLDDFKRINDSYGHEAGDEVLKHVATMIKRELPGCDICRWGGEEFVILLNGCDMLTAKGQVERLRKSIESNPTSFFGKNIFVTTTIGLEENKDIYSIPEDIIKVADARMYYGKQHGKNILVTEDNE
ncbi:MAG: GGDEF domain-containing protein [Saccharofermentans sp.]|nr:GGDEF domain-containing protein [Saccharofermentans sp.]